GYLVLITACLIGMHYLQSLRTDKGKLVRNKEYFSSNLNLIINETPNLIMFILFSGWILFAMARLILEIHLNGFSIPGILTISLSTVIVTGIIYGLVTKQTIIGIQNRVKIISQMESLSNS